MPLLITSLRIVHQHCYLHMSKLRVRRGVLAARLVERRRVEVGAAAQVLRAAAERHGQAARPEAPQLPHGHVVVTGVRHAAAFKLEMGGKDKEWYMVVTFRLPKLRKEFSE